jgi:hypothetical protein
MRLKDLFSLSTYLEDGKVASRNDSTARKMKKRTIMLMSRAV